MVLMSEMRHPKLDEAYRWHIKGRRDVIAPGDTRWSRVYAEEALTPSGLLPCKRLDTICPLTYELEKGRLLCFL